MQLIRPVFEKVKKGGGDHRRKCCSSPNKIPLKHDMHHFFDNFLNCPYLFQNVLNRVFTLSDLLKNRKGMPKMTTEKSMKRSD